jgi:hypothetical protein
LISASDSIVFRNEQKLPCRGSIPLLTFVSH